MADESIDNDDTITPRYIKYKQVNLATLVEGEPKAPFSIILKQCIEEGTTPFPGLLYFTLDTYLTKLRVNQGGIKYHFGVFGMTRPRIEPLSPGLLTNMRLTNNNKKIGFEVFKLNLIYSFFIETKTFQIIRKKS